MCLLFLWVTQCHCCFKGSHGMAPSIPDIFQLYPCHLPWLEGSSDLDMGHRSITVFLCEWVFIFTVLLIKVTNFLLMLSLPVVLFLDLQGFPGCFLVWDATYLWFPIIFYLGFFTSWLPKVYMSNCTLKIVFDFLWINKKLYLFV